MVEAGCVKLPAMKSGRRVFDRLRASFYEFPRRSLNILTAFVFAYHLLLYSLLLPGERDFMKFKSNESLGIMLMVLALVLVIAAFTLSASLGITAVALFFIGAHLFYTERVQRRANPPLKPNPSSPAAVSASTVSTASSADSGSNTVS
jgi:hypothetical protein